MENNIPLERHLRALRFDAESEIRAILAKQYMQQVDPGVPVRYYLDFKSDPRLLELKEILERMDTGTYGRCVLCKQPFEEAQMRKLLSVTVCQRCATAHLHETV
jgi:hypothetical protein